MTPDFDKFIDIVMESKHPRCKVPTNTQLSHKPQYRFTKCVEAPYTDGVKRIFFGKRNEKISFDKCKGNPVPGTAKYEECKLFLKALKHKKKKRKSSNNNK